MIISSYYYFSALIFFVVIASINYYYCLFYLKKITPEPQNSDAMKQIRAAAKADTWRWPSDMHKYTVEKAYMKDVGVILLAIFQRILKDKFSFHPIIAATSFAHSISIVLIYIIAYHWWGLVPGITVGLLFASSFWSYQIILGGAYQGIAIFFFLSGIYFLQLSDNEYKLASYLFYFASGISFGLMSFSSASARKLYIAVIIAYIFSTENSLLGLEEVIILNVATVNIPNLVGVAILLFFSMLLVFNFHLIYKALLNLFYENKLPIYISDNFFRGRNIIPRTEYLKREKIYKEIFVNLLIVIWIYGISCFLLAKNITFYFCQVYMVCGILLVFLVLMAPNFLDHLRGYIYYWQIPKLTNHQHLYQDYFKREGLRSPKKISAGGWRWYYKFHWLFTPHILLALVISSLLLFVLTIVHENTIFELTKLILILSVAISPIIFGELTQSPQIARAYYPSFVTLLFPVGCLVFELSKLNFLPDVFVLLIFLGSLYITHSIYWNGRILISDICPARMSGAKLIDIMLNNSKSAFFAYDIPQNELFANSILYGCESNIRVNFVKSINEIKEGFLIVPGIIHLAMNVGSSGKAQSSGDFRSDQLLNILIDTGKIKDVSIASFHTVASSRYWAQEGEMIAYIDLIHNKISQSYRNLGRGWLVDVARAREILGNRCS